MGYYSPLRYPGGKAKIADYVKTIISTNHLIDGHYIEPYAGGASVALDLVINEYVSSVHINDIDKRIFSFWHSVIFDTDNLCKKIQQTEINVDEWRKQKAIQKKPSDNSMLDVGFSTFFLNRTNRSGILKAGVIGGLEQTGKWKIDARFNKQDLINRITMIARYGNRINIYNLDAIDFIKKTQKIIPQKSLTYLDPPYYNKGKQLYINFYEHNDHIEIADLIKSVTKGNWIISYDDHREIKEMYKNYRQKQYSLSYSAGTTAKGSEVIVYDDKLIIPEIENPTNKKEVKKYYAQHCVL